MSKQPRKQRKALYNDPLHKRRKRLSVNLSKDLREDYGKRSLTVKAGDTVEVVRGEYKEKKGKVVSVDVKNYKVKVEGVIAKKTEGTDIFVPIHPSNLVIVDTDMKDDFRNKVLDRVE